MKEEMLRMQTQPVLFLREDLLRLFVFGDVCNGRKHGFVPSSEVYIVLCLVVRLVHNCWAMLL